MTKNWKVAKDKPINQLREKLSHWQHEIWSTWMRYQFNLCIKNTDGSYTIPKEKAERWNRQINTPYSKLSESERDSDREQVDKFIHLV